MRVLVVSDIHSNLAALDAVIQDAGGLDRVWCLGDVVGYGPQPNECIERLRSFDLVCLAGNHDLGVLGKLDVAEFSRDAAEVVYWTRERLAAGHVRWLATLPSMMTFAEPQHAEHPITLVHASPRDPVWEYVATPATASACFAAMDTPICLYGHTHVPILFRKPEFEIGIATEQLSVNSALSLKLDRMMINPGSVGQPRDEDARAAYAILDLDAMTLTHRRVQYDISATQNLMKRARLPDRLIRRLRFGQ